MVGGWPLFTPTLLDRPGSRAKVKIVAVDALPAQLPYVEKGLAPVLLAQPTYLWGHVGVATIVDKVHLKQDVPPVHAHGAGARHQGEPRRPGRASSRTGASPTCRRST